MPAFDFAFNFRGTLGYVTDPAYAVAVLGETYPHLYTNGDGLTINGGYVDSSQMNFLDRVNTDDPRIAGLNYRANNGAGAPTIFQVDLSSGSAPGTGVYTVDLAMGAADIGGKMDWKLQDTSTLLIDGTNGGAGTDTNPGHFIDATLVDVTASTTWTGTTVNKTFATTLVKLLLSPDNCTGNGYVAHFRLTLVPPAGGPSMVFNANSLNIAGVPPLGYL